MLTTICLARYGWIMTWPASLTYLLDELLGDVGHVPVGRGARHAHHEVAQDLQAADRVRHLERQAGRQAGSKTGQSSSRAASDWL